MTELEKKFWPTTVTALSEDIQGWRIRQRYAVDDAGRVGNFRKWSHELVTRSDHQCIQEASELSDIPHIEALAPGSELVFAVGDDGQCHAVNLQYPAANKTTKRGSRSRATARRAQRAKTPRAVSCSVLGRSTAGSGCGMTMRQIVLAGPSGCGSNVCGFSNSRIRSPLVITPGISMGAVEFCTSFTRE